MTLGPVAACVHLTTAVATALPVLIVLAGPTAAQDISINLGQGNSLTERVFQLIALLTVCVFMLKNVREKDLQLFTNLSIDKPVDQPPYFNDEFATMNSAAPPRATARL